MNNSDYALIISGVSLLISFFTVVWNIRKDSKEYGKLKIRLLFGSTVDGFGRIEENKLFVFATNTGNRDVVLETIAGQYFKNKHINNIQSLLMNTLLTPKNDIQDFFIKLDSQILHQRIKSGEVVNQELGLGEPIEKLKCLYVIDTTGKKYYASKKQIVDISKQVRELSSHPKTK